MFASPALVWGFLGVAVTALAGVVSTLWISRRRGTTHTDVLMKNAIALSTAATAQATTTNTRMSELQQELDDERDERHAAEEQARAERQADRDYIDLLVAALTAAGLPVPPRPTRRG